MITLTMRLPKEAHAWTRLRGLLLVCGIAASLLYVGADIVAAMLWAEYRYADQAVSELMAIGALTRPFLIACFSVYNALMIAFGIGVWREAHGRRALRITGILLATYAAVGWAGLLLAPMHPRGAEFSATDVIHIVITAVIVLALVLSIGFGAAVQGKGFRRYSIATIGLLMVFSGLTGMQGSRIAAGLPTPWAGVTERVSIYATMLWVGVLAVVLLRNGVRTGAGGSHDG